MQKAEADGQGRGEEPVWIRIERRRPDASHSDGHERGDGTRESPEPLGRAGARRSRVLVIDDETPVRELVCEFLRLLGNEATGVATGREGLAVFEGAAYDLVVTDLSMPGMTGWELVAAVQQCAPAVGVIMMTASATTLDADRAREAGVTLLLKPFGLQDLRDAVEHALRPLEERAV